MQAPSAPAGRSTGLLITHDKRTIGLISQSVMRRNEGGGDPRRHWAHAGRAGLAASMAGMGVGAGAGAGRLLGGRRVDLCTTFQAGRAWTGGPSSIGGGVLVAGGGAGGSWGCWMSHKKQKV